MVLTSHHKGVKRRGKLVNVLIHTLTLPALRQRVNAVANPFYGRQQRPYQPEMDGRQNYESHQTILS